MTGGGTRQPGFSSEMLRDNRQALTKSRDVYRRSTVTVPTDPTSRRYWRGRRRGDRPMGGTAGQLAGLGLVATVGVAIR